MAISEVVVIANVTVIVIYSSLFLPQTFYTIFLILPITNNMVNLIGSALFLIWYIFSLYCCLNWGPSDPEANDVPICHRASLPL